MDSRGICGTVIWHLLVNNENSYSLACEIRGEVPGSINQLVLHDMAVFKEFLNMTIRR